ncbi:diguanylate cyclase domain-containing protein [Thermodesulfatator atlanticus]|uniref:diguanylate cyclase domain-containing protein n=1 Tax=Thermodesulfatator atlanticus TaxID=501497 RepID=UPI0003FF6008|nr:diguanylate cyclase [Thermodesulfatator atlanticus]
MAKMGNRLYINSSLKIKKNLKKIITSQELPVVIIVIKIKNYLDIRKNYGLKISDFYLQRVAKKIDLILKNARFISFLCPDLFVAILNNESDLQKTRRKNI